MIFLTSKDEEIDELFGLKMGADDFIRKPFSQRLLVERVKAVLRRVSPKDGIVVKEADSKVLERGLLRMDPERHTCTWKNEPVTLTVTEFLILQALASRPGVVKSRNALMDAAYDDQVYVDDRTIDSHIKRLRKKFKASDDEFDMIETLYGVGLSVQRIGAGKALGAVGRRALTACEPWLLTGRLTCGNNGVGLIRPYLSPGRGGGQPNPGRRRARSNGRNRRTPVTRAPHRRRPNLRSIIWSTATPSAMVSTRRGCAPNPKASPASAIGAQRAWQFFITQSFSSLTRRIVVLNLTGLIGAVDRLYLFVAVPGRSDRRARIQSLLVQSQIIAGAIASSATVETDSSITLDPDKLLNLQPGQSYGSKRRRALRHRLSDQSGTGGADLAPAGFADQNAGTHLRSRRRAAGRQPQFVRTAAMCCVTTCRRRRRNGREYSSGLTSRRARWLGRGRSAALPTSSGPTTAKAIPR